MFSGCHIDGGSTQLEVVAAGADRDANALFDLAQMAVQMATQRGQMARIIGFQSEALFYQLSR